MGMYRRRDVAPFLPSSESSKNDQLKAQSTTELLVTRTAFVIVVSLRTQPKLTLKLATGWGAGVRVGVDFRWTKRAIADEVSKLGTGRVVCYVPKGVP